MGHHKYDWPPIDALVALVQKHGQTGASSLLGVPRTTLRDHLQQEGVSARQTPQSLNLDALKEVADLVK